MFNICIAKQNTDFEFYKMSTTSGNATRLYSSGRGVTYADDAGSKTSSDGSPVTANLGALNGAVFIKDPAGYLTQYLPATPSSSTSGIDQLSGLPSSVKPLKSSLFGDLLTDAPSGTNKYLLYGGMAVAAGAAIYWLSSPKKR